MGNYLGIDLGSWMLKAAATESGSSRSAPVNLAPAEGRGYLPAVARPHDPMGATWALFARRRSDPAVASGFRDRVLDPAGTVACGTESASVTELWAALFRGVQQAIVAAVANPLAVALSVPDPWPPGAWALAPGLAAAGWNPLLLIREGLAVLAVADGLAARPALLLSLGAASAQATWYALSEGHWTAVACQSDPQLSGSRLRQKLVAWFAEEVIRQLRRDPTESPQDDQALHDAIEVAMAYLAAHAEIAVQATLFGQAIARPLSRGWLAQLAQPMLEALSQLVRRALRVQPGGSGPCQVLAWGELALLLPVTDCLQALLPQATPVTILSPNAVAQGAARLCALAAEGRLDLASPALAGLERQSGIYLPTFSPAHWATAWPLLERLPLDCSAASRPQAARLVRLDAAAGRREMPLGDGLRLGRDPKSDWVIEESLYPQVSRAHAALRRLGQRYLLCDLGSTNGTYLNGQPVEGEVPLHHGDLIRLGLDGPTFRFLIQQE